MFIERKKFPVHQGQTIYAIGIAGNEYIRSQVFTMMVTKLSTSGTFFTVSYQTQQEVVFDTNSFYKGDFIPRSITDFIFYETKEEAEADLKLIRQEFNDKLSQTQAALIDALNHGTVSIYTLDHIIEHLDSHSCVQYDTPSPQNMLQEVRPQEYTNA